MNKKAIIFTIDGIYALLLIASITIIFQNIHTTKVKDLEEFTISQKIHDILITSQILELDDINKISENYIKLFGKRTGYIKLNKKIKRINKNKDIQKFNLISNYITYINDFGDKIYIEIGVYY